MLNSLYNFTKQPYSYAKLLLLTLLLAGCSKKDDSIIPVVPPVVVTKALKEKALFPIGAAVTVSHLKEADFANAFLRY